MPRRQAHHGGGPLGDGLAVTFTLHGGLDQLARKKCKSPETQGFVSLIGNEQRKLVRRAIGDYSASRMFEAC